MRLADGFIQSNLQCIQVIHVLYVNLYELTINIYELIIQTYMILKFNSLTQISK